MINVKMPKSVIKGACQKYPKGGGGVWGGCFT